MLKELKAILVQFENGLVECDVMFQDADFEKLANLRGETWKKFKLLAEKYEKY